MSRKIILRIFCLALSFAGCASNPQQADIRFDSALPETKAIFYQNAIDKFGLMTEIYGDDPATIIVNNVSDNTDTSAVATGTIARDITEVVKSTLNRMGGHVYYIPYEPGLRLETVPARHSRHRGKLFKPVMLAGGMTEFARGSHVITESNESTLAGITLDFNLIDFTTLTGIPGVQAINGIKLRQATRKDRIAFTIKSTTFGAQGEIDKAQSHQAAIRLLVQLNLMQLIGRYQQLPYWRLLPGVEPDKVVIDRVLSDYQVWTRSVQIAQCQELLYLHGYNVKPTGQVDRATQSALQDFAQKQGLRLAEINQKTYWTLYENVPLNDATRQFRKALQNDAAMMRDDNFIDSFSALPSSAANSAASGALLLSTDKAEYRIGEPMNIHFSVSQPMYVRIVVINSQGRVDTVFPNIYQPDNYCLPGKTYRIPPPDAEFTIDATGPAGTDKLRAVASRHPIPADALYFTRDGQFDESRMTLHTVKFALDYAIR
ncbi:MAG: DUF4384 domain-containing protein [Methylomicrobium sp.]